MTNASSFSFPVRCSEGNRMDSGLALPSDIEGALGCFVVVATTERRANRTVCYEGYLTGITSEGVEVEDLDHQRTIVPTEKIEEVVFIY